MYKRLIETSKKSFFLFGPRGTGKSTCLKSLFKNALYIDLLKSRNFLKYQQHPSILQEEVKSQKLDSWIIINEIQKIPELLDEVHSLIFKFGQQYKFVLSGPSTRKINRNSGNLLAGRALNKKMFPLSILEIEDFSLEPILRFGQLPLSVNVEEAMGKIELGQLFETFFINELRLIKSYKNYGYKFSYWRTSSGTEVDLLIERGKRVIGIEIKYSQNWKESYNKGLTTLKKSHAIEKAYGIFIGDIPRKQASISIFPYQLFLKKFSEKDLFS